MTAPEGDLSFVFVEFEADPAAPRDRLRGEAERLGGTVVKPTATGLFLAFPDADAAATFGLLAVEDPSRPRLGIHRGAAILQKDPGTGLPDYVGPAVNRAARLAAAGHFGQLLLSAAAADEAPDGLESAAVSDLGEHRLRGIERPERILQAAPPSRAGIRFPPLRTLASRPTNLPPQATTFVGRERELADLSSLLSRDGPPVVLTGGAGTGKTRLAVRLAADLLESLEGGCWIVDLCEARTAEDAGRSLVESLGGAVDPRRPAVESASAVLELARPLFVILDTFEHLAPLARETIEVWAAKAPHARLLVTSRVALDLPGAREFRLEPLPAPRPGGRTGLAEAQAFDAVRLFVERAREAKPGFLLTGGNAEDVAEICADLEGIPLAIELAASRIRVLDPAAMVKKLGQKFHVLRSPRQDATRRQQTLSAALDWSHDLLKDAEKAALEQASVFHGGFLRDAADAVLDLSAFSGAPRGAEAIDGLVARSLVSRSSTPWGPRFSLYRPVRDYVRARTGAAGSDAAAARHEAHYLSVATVWDAKRRTADDVEARGRLELDLENILAAHERARAGGRTLEAARMLLSLSPGVTHRYAIPDAAERLKRTIGALGAASPSPEALGIRGILETHLALCLEDAGDRSGSLRAVEAGIEAARRSGRTADLAETLVTRLTMLWRTGDYDGALALADECESVARSAGDVQNLARIQACRALVLIWRGRSLEALPLIDAALALHRRIGYRFGELASMMALGLARGNLGDSRGARECYEDIIREADALGFHTIARNARSNLAGIYSDMGEFEEAEEMFSRLEDSDRRMGSVLSLGHDYANRGVMSLRRARYDEAMERFEKAGEILRRVHDRSAEAQNYRNMANVRIRQGRLEDAVTLARRSLGVGGVPADEGMQAEADLILGRVAFLQGRHEEATACFRRMQEVYDRTGEIGVRLFEGQALAARNAEAAGEREEARRLARRALETAGRLEIDAGVRDSYTRELLTAAKNIAD
jgi:predicted ATPase/Tfp pilus assembly protein PilF